MKYFEVVLDENFLFFRTTSLKRAVKCFSEKIAQYRKPLISLTKIKMARLVNFVTHSMCISVFVGFDCDFDKKNRSKEQLILYLFSNERYTLWCYRLISNNLECYSWCIRINDVLWRYWSFWWIRTKYMYVNKWLMEVHVGDQVNFMNNLIDFVYR